MKQLLLKTLACAAVLLPLTQAHAANFPKGTTFTMTVKEKVSAKAVGFKVTNNVPVPDGIPNFKVGQRVKFVIGTKGQLTIPKADVSLPFKQDAGTANVYYVTPTRTNPKANIGQVFKDSAGKPATTALTFFKVKPTTLTTWTVSYTLE